MAVDRVNGIAVGNSYNGSKNTNTYTSEDFTKAISDKIDELKDKIANGDTEAKFQIGDESYTIKEWNRLLEKFDSQEEAVKKLMKEEQEDRLEDAQKSKEAVESMRKKLNKSYNLD